MATIAVTPSIDCLSHRDKELYIRFATQPWWQAPEGELYKLVLASRAKKRIVHDGSWVCTKGFTTAPFSHRIEPDIANFRMIIDTIPSTSELSTRPLDGDDDNLTENVDAGAYLYALRVDHQNS